MYPIHLPSQLSAYLRSLRKTKGLTQADLGKMLGVSRARVGEIEKDPSNVGFSQLLRILHLLGARLMLDVESSRPAAGATVSEPPRGEW